MLKIQMMLGYEGNQQERNGQRGTGMVANGLKSEWQVGQRMGYSVHAESELAVNLR